jgi:hypothetical protein
MSLSKWAALLAAGLIAAAAGLVAGCTGSYTQLATNASAESPADQPTAYAPDYDQSYQEPASDPFADLSLYGTWVDVHPFGHVWRPSVVQGWQPYYHGRWVWANVGWTWVSYEPFGWATYHYGYWYYDAIWGWIWIPGDQWFPSRVDWLMYGDDICWAPMPPPGYYIGDPWSAQVDVIWVVVDIDHFTYDHVGRYAARSFRQEHPRIESRISRGRSPDVKAIEKRIHRDIRPVDIQLRTIRVGDRQVQRMKLPPTLEKSVEENQPRIEKQVIKKAPERKPRVGRPEVQPPRKPATKEKEKPAARKEARPEVKKKKKP